MNGKQKAYVVEQSTQPTASDAELAELDKKLKEAEESARKTKLEADKAEGFVRGMAALPVTEEVLRQIAGLEEEVRAMEAKVKTLSARSDLVDKAEVTRLEKGRDDAVATWRKRRRMCLGVTDAILESYPKNKKALFEDVGIETEEDLGIKMLQT